MPVSMFLVLSSQLRSQDVHIIVKHFRIFLKRSKSQFFVRLQIEGRIVCLPLFDLSNTDILVTCHFR